jgi:hypothetical protein
MGAAIRWLKASYIAGAVADGLIGILMLLPDRMGESEFRYSMGLGASLMFGWTALLLWANSRPIERRGVLILTIFPVIGGLLATGIWAVGTGRFPVQRIVPSSIVALALIALMTYSYRKANAAENQGVT